MVNKFEAHKKLTFFVKYLFIVLIKFVKPFEKFIKHTMGLLGWIYLISPTNLIRMKIAQKIKFVEFSC